MSVSRTVGVRLMYIGRYTTEIEAAAAYNKEALAAFGEYARLNIVGGNDEK